MLEYYVTFHLYLINLIMKYEYTSILHSTYK